ncbi:hypothetical protein P618_200772 [Holospora obtusa F1]|uniref:Uncharacterized protein n=1 Tax=Holospora obtusa F1 TaxID=1399147 RepID=W6TDF6_HOLOB|nr:hypothetical protein P618_200772 [Holospora obtusa F1]
MKGVCLPEEKHVHGKNITSTHSDILHRLASFKRKIIFSYSRDMAYKTMKLFHYFQYNQKNVSLYMTTLLSFFI